jgi:hypothetical protein
VQLKDSGALGTESSFIVRAARVAFDVDDLPVDRMNERAASDGAKGTDAGRHLRVFDAQLLCPGHSRSEVDA